VTGKIVNFIHEKGFGFVQGDDGISYFLHIKEFGPGINLNKVIKGAKVSFTEESSSKGPQATKAQIMQKHEQKVSYGGNESQCGSKYITPDTTFYSREGIIPGWEIIQDSGWDVIGSTRDAGESPDSAKNEMLRKAKAIGANAVVNAKYEKTTGSRGNYKFSLHHQVGRAVIIGKKSPSGKSVDEIKFDMDKAARDLVAAAEAEKSTAYTMMWSIIGVITVLAFIMIPGNAKLWVGCGAFAISTIFGLIMVSGTGSYVLDGYVKRSK
jgi:cold shock CspA family protein